jgi:hypothetical protein
MTDRSNFQVIIISDKGKVEITNLSGYSAESIADRMIHSRMPETYRYAAIFVYNVEGMLDYIRGEKFNTESGV